MQLCRQNSFFFLHSRQDAWGNTAKKYNFPLYFQITFNFRGEKKSLLLQIEYKILPWQIGLKTLHFPATHQKVLPINSTQIHPSHYKNGFQILHCSYLRPCQLMRHSCNLSVDPRHFQRQIKNEAGQVALVHCPYLYCYHIPVFCKYDIVLPTVSNCLI